MSKITGKEPQHWHDKDGRHIMPDYRDVMGPQDRDEKSYYEHLNEHDHLETVRWPSDSIAVSGLFDLIDNNDRMNNKARLLIQAIRQKEAQNARKDDQQDDGHGSADGPAPSTP